MLVRLEKIRKTNSSLVIDEVDRLLGKIREDKFIDCLLDRDVLMENEYTYFFVDKELLNKNLSEL